MDAAPFFKQLKVVVPPSVRYTGIYKVTRDIRTWYYFIMKK